MTEAKKRGRPRGAGNKPIVETICIPAICPTCGGSGIKTIRGREVQKMESEGALPNGFNFSRIVWRDCICDCGQQVRVRTYYPD
jgi:hypothetical protein